MPRAQRPDILTGGDLVALRHPRRDRLVRGAPPVAVVDRQAARKALLELAGRAALEDMMAANDVFDELFVLASARVAARETETLAWLDEARR